MTLAKRSALIFCSFIVFLTSAIAQPGFEHALPIDDPELYHSFIRYHDDLNNWLVKQKQANPLKSAALDASIAHQLNVTPAEFVQIALITHAALLSLQGLEQEVGAYQNAQKVLKLLPDEQVMSQFESRRYLVSIQVQNKLRQTLAPTSWNSLRSYINGKFRSEVKLYPLEPHPSLKP